MLVCNAETNECLAHLRLYHIATPILQMKQQETASIHYISCEHLQDASKTNQSTQAIKLPVLMRTRCIYKDGTVVCFAFVKPDLFDSVETIAMSL